MSRYRFEDIRALPPEVRQIAINFGKFSQSRLYIELPDGFDFGPHKPQAVIGLGDVVESIAHPIARALDAVLGTGLVNCGGCQDRKAALNEKMPEV